MGQFRHIASPSIDSCAFRPNSESGLEKTNDKCQVSIC